MQLAHCQPTLILRFTSTWKSASSHSIHQVSPVSHCGPSVSFLPLTHTFTLTIRARPLFRWNVRVVVFLSFLTPRACCVSPDKREGANSGWQYLYTGVPTKTYRVSQRSQNYVKVSLLVNVELWHLYIRLYYCLPYITTYFLVISPNGRRKSWQFKCKPRSCSTSF